MVEDIAVVVDGAIEEASNEIANALDELHAMLNGGDGEADWVVAMRKRTDRYNTAMMMSTFNGQPLNKVLD